MNGLDYMLLGVVLLSGVHGMSRGVVRELLSILLWAGSIMVALILAESVAPLLPDFLPWEPRLLLAGFGVFVCLTMVGSILIRHFSMLLRSLGGSFVDHVLGGFFGLARGVLVMVVALALLQLLVGQFLPGPPGWYDNSVVAMGVQPLVAPVLEWLEGFWHLTLAQAEQLL